MKIKLGCSPFAIRKLVEGISLQGKLRIKSCKLVFTGPRFLKISLNFENLCSVPTIRRGHKKEHDASYPYFNH